MASMLLRLPRAARQLATRGTTGLLWTLAFADLAAGELEGVFGTAAVWFSTFLLKAFVRRVNRRIDIRIVRF